ncbi:hypothetical protein [Actinomadura verrucosospora]|uniref:Uncharacterized protein n=1 Tax=Actinomadura verrucosospora TaxID=46165 RepID=A0A7D3W038_ACTVE|nr:hypothetical protein [Actinomadura verrucosospora]QKG23051.1 hypothetical protein ACTIVE_4692 [Actinomadura verrucosospora]
MEPLSPLARRNLEKLLLRAMEGSGDPVLTEIADAVASGQGTLRDIAGGSAYADHFMRALRGPVEHWQELPEQERDRLRAEADALGHALESLDPD